MAPLLRVLLVADTHLGFDGPLHARVERRRRGADFLANFERALQPALRGEVDAVVHGGDLLYRSRVPAALAERALRPLAEVAARGVPVLLVPGNHERSRIPYPIFAAHARLHLFDRPRTVALPFGGGVAAFSGFPFAPEVRARFPALLAATGFAGAPAALRILCLHQAVEGARVGTPEFTFRGAPDTIRGADLPAGFAAVLCGHIHRGQRLSRGLDGRPLPAPVFYPGSVERTSFAERHETKGTLLLHFCAGRGEPPGGRVAGFQWIPLPARPMVRLALPAQGQDGAALRAALARRLAALPGDAVVRIGLEGDPAPGAQEELTAARVRALAPAEMNVDCDWWRRYRGD